MSKTRLVMKRLCNVKPGDLMVGRSGWTQLDSIREVVKVVPSKSRSGKLRIEYRLPGRGPWDIGWLRRGPDFYVICVKQ